MGSRSVAERWTYDEFARLPDDGNRYEVIAGELYVTPSPRFAHQEVSMRLSELIGPFVRRSRLGRFLAAFDVLFGEGDYLEPDFVFLRRGRTDLARSRGVEGAPDLVIEIHRPGERLPQIERDILRWQPILDGPVLEIDIQELLSDLE